jgi:choline dehydrogenase-like flavoprotein
MRAKMKSLFKKYNVLTIHAAEKNEMLAHVCGTCKMGIDPTTSVVDAENKLHGFENIYIADSSFFPTSGGTNPALTIAANSLRLAEILIAKERAARPGQIQIEARPRS